MYSKKKIDLLFRRYVEEGDDEIFGELMEAVDPMIDVVLRNYSKYDRHFSDLKQEVKLKMWKNQRNPKKLGRSKVAPSVYMFFLIRSYTLRAFEKLMRAYGDTEYDVFVFHSEDWISGIGESLPDEEGDDEI